MGQLCGNLNLFEKAIGADGVRQVGLEHLEGDQATVLQVLGEEHDGHAAPTELALDTVAVGNCGL
jgi:hypothetical protein